MRKQWTYCLAIIFILVTVCPDSEAQKHAGGPVTAFVAPKDTVSPTRTSMVNAEKSFVVGEIYISGNKRTRSHLILRELTFKKGDSISLAGLVKAFKYGHDQLINTSLFTTVVISLKGFRGNLVDVKIEVTERWYIIPVPYFHPIDRNLTVWGEHDYSLSRVNYGLKYTQNNFSGRNDNVILWLVTGYSQQVELSYDLPYAEASLKHGFGFSAIYAANYQMDAATKNNQQYFINSDTIAYAPKYLSEQLSFSLRYYYRPAIKTRHTVRLNFINIKIDSAVTVYNPDYFLNGKREVFFPEFLYQLDYTNVDYVAYPLKGVAASGSFLRRGINSEMNLWQLYLQSTESWKIADKTYLNFQDAGMLKLPFDQPFYNQQIFGYGNFYLRGLEAYVIDGEAGFVERNTILRELFNFSLPVKVPFLGLYRVPIRIMAKAYSDIGYVYSSNPDPTNTLSRQFLYTEGVGIDIVTSYDFVFRIEYSFNQLGQNGLFLHIHNDF